jgi:cell division protein FtsW
MNLTRNDILIILPLSILIILGMIMVPSSSIYVADDMTSNPFYFAQRQIFFYSSRADIDDSFLILPSNFFIKLIGFLCL